MSGINILNSIPVMRNPSYYNILFIISIICIILGGTFLMLYYYFEKISTLIISSVLMLSAVIIPFYLKQNQLTVQTGKYQYEVIIDDNVQFKDVNKEKENKKYMKTTKIKIKKLNNLAIIPERGSEYSAGMDLHATISEPIYISPHETIKIPTGLAMELPEGTFGAIFARSGLATKEGLRPSNCTGVCDSDYRGEYIVALHNDSNMSRIINPGERIAQLVVLPYVPIEFKEVDKLSDTDRGFGGFGSTGK